MNIRKLMSSLALVVTVAGGGLTVPFAVQANDSHKMERFTMPYEETVPAPFTCSGEDVHIYGDIELMAQTTTNSNGDVHAVFHVTPHLAVTGVTSGLTYRTAGPLQTVTNVSPTGASEYHLTNIVVLISLGSTDNLVLHENMKVTINASGVTTVDFDDFAAECRG
jgi:hypothetical protein